MTNNNDNILTFILRDGVYHLDSKVMNIAVRSRNEARLMFPRAKLRFI